MPFVVDASMAGSWCFDDEQSPSADAAMDRLCNDEAMVPSIWWFEIRNILIVNEWRGRIERADADAFLADLGRLPIRIRNDAEDRAVMGLARMHRLTAYDAAYLDLARRLKAPLATLDRSLARAAQSEGIELIESSRLS